MSEVSVNIIDCIEDIPTDILINELLKRGVSIPNHEFKEGLKKQYIYIYLDVDDCLYEIGLDCILKYLNNNFSKEEILNELSPTECDEGVELFKSNCKTIIDFNMSSNDIRRELCKLVDSNYMISDEVLLDKLKSLL